MSSVARRVAVSGALVVVLALATVGVATGGVLHAREIRALDRMLLAAAHERARPEGPGQWEVEDGESPVEAWIVGPGDPRVPPDDARYAIDEEVLVFTHAGDLRLLLLPVEHEYDEDDEVDLLVAAAAPRITLAESVGPFVVIYGALATTASVLSAMALWIVVRLAFRPLARARQEAERVVALGQGQRLTDDAPVEIRGLLRAVNRLLDRLDAAHGAQQRFTAEAAHELRTPVSTMLGELDVALRRPRSAEEYRAVLASTREEVDRLRAIVQALTALTRIDAGQAEAHRDLVRAAELAGRALATERPTLEGAGCEVRLVVEDDPELEVHTSLVEIALGNLLRNAARHAPGGPVTLRVRADADRAVFEVDDAGPGVPFTEREAVFDRFARAGISRRHDRQGLGLGLPLAREVARRHGGDCVLEEAPGGGARARLWVARGRTLPHATRAPPRAPHGRAG